MRTLIVDDSIVFRHLVEAALAGCPEVEVVGSARNGVKALEALAQCRPDLLTLDLEMPDMDGLATLAELNKLNASRPKSERVGVIVISAHTRSGASATMRALELGAFDFIPKPACGSEAESIALLRAQLLPRLRAYALSRPGGLAARRERDTTGTFAVAGAVATARTGPPPARLSAAPTTVAPAAATTANTAGARASITPANTTAGARASITPASTALTREGSAAEVLCIGVSTGGPRALADMLPALCEVTTLPVLIVQHMPPTFTAPLAEGLANRCKRRVKEADDGELVEPATVYIAPGGRHMVLARGATRELTLRLNDNAPENGCRPSVDVLFRAVAQVCRGAAVAVVMTGMGNDGEQGVRVLKRDGARVIAQDEATSVVWGMPGSAVATGLVDQVVPLMQIPQAVRRALGGR